jgi:hypothetical protein
VIGPILGSSAGDAVIQRVQTGRPSWNWAASGHAGVRVGARRGPRLDVGCLGRPGLVRTHPFRTEGRSDRVGRRSSLTASRPLVGTGGECRRDVRRESETRLSPIRVGRTPRRASSRLAKGPSHIYPAPDYRRASLRPSRGSLCERGGVGQLGARRGASATRQKLGRPSRHLRSGRSRC